MRAIFSIFGLIAAVGVFTLYTQPAYDNVQALQKEIAGYDQALDKAAELQEIKAALLERRKAFDPEDLDRLEKMLPNHVDNVRLILDLDRLAGHYGMALQNVVVSDPASASGGDTVIGSASGGDQKYDSLTLKFATRGTYSNFVKFLEDLEASLRIVDVVSLSLGAEGGSSQLSRSSDNAYRYEIAIRTYWLR